MSVLFVSVGGSPAPIIHSINSKQPEFIIFFTSTDSRKTAVEDVLPALFKQPKDREFITTSDGQNLEICVEAISKRLPEILKTWGVGYEQLDADYTGGTKTMSAAVVLFLSKHIAKFSYVGGVERDKAGLGIVLDGREQMLYVNNPWNVLALEELSDIALFFNSCRFENVIELVDVTLRRTEARKNLFSAIKVLAQAYGLWDGFQYGKALTKLKEADSKLQSLTAETEQKWLIKFQKAVNANLSILELIVIEQNVTIKSTPKPERKDSSLNEDDSHLIKDLLSNAVRRAEVEHKYEDAVARLYSALEKMAKLRLKLKYDIDNSDVKPEQLPTELLDEFKRECSNTREDGKIQLPLHKSYQLLFKLSDSLGEAYMLKEVELGKLLSIRNNSLLAHGFEPIKKETYEKMLVIALAFLNIEKSSLPLFAHMDSPE